ncbi:very short patch repair endonuclease [Ciceribacter sp. L1K22]|uniref:very short patch repair endonuclease n=1 Tax=Ciceribacter sp. L1K22 TaxID=2820275 RepID=UPI001ABE3F0E|nr:very short patch repair endonuclease [Ciceribacter sp. L1K22]MBO3759994.1 DNA mismatch endonuclease Vsr [Ciceribacter sp. L1K22]
MADIVSGEVRSRMMSGIRGKDTRPEMLIRRALHAGGFRYRLHEKRLSGKPDLVFPRLRAVLFVHGCFWHGHDCHLFRLPSTRTDFWRDKIAGNVERDRRSTEALRDTGWRVGTVWECALKGKTRLPLASIVDSLALWLRSDQVFLDIRGAAV